MAVGDHIAMLEREWDADTGFLWNFRNGLFDDEGYGRLSSALIRIGEDTRNATVLDKRFVSLVWFIPLLMEWNCSRVVELGGNETRVNEATASIQSLVMAILGVP